MKVKQLLKNVQYVKLLQKNLEMRVAAENGATAGKVDLAKRARAAGYDDVADAVMEMAKDEARHGRALNSLLLKHFK